MTKENCKILIVGKDQKLSDFMPYDEFDYIFTFDLATEFDGIQDNLPIFYFHRISQSKDVWDEICKKSKKWLEEWHNTKILGNKSILDIFKFNDLSLWWLVFDQIWTEKNGIFDTLYYFETLSWILKKYNPKNVELLGEFDYPLELLLKQMEKIFKIKISQNVKLKENSITKNENKIKKNIFYLIKLIILKIFIHNKLKKYSLLIISNNSRFVRKGKKKIANCEVYLNGLESILEENSEKVKFVTNDNTFINQNKNKFLQIIRYLKTNDQDAYISTYSIKSILLQKIFLNKITKKILEVEKEQNFKNSWMWNEINVYPLIQKIFQKILPKLLVLAKNELKTSILKKYTPKIVLLTEGLSIRTRALSYLSNKMGTNIIIPQVGIYTSNPIPTGLLIHKSFDTRVLPNYLIWGNFYETFYKKCGYPDSKIRNVGFFRNIQSSKYSHGKKYILYVAGANLNRFDYIHTFDEEIFTIKKIQENLPPDFDLIVKLHPGHPIDLYKKNLNNLERTEIVTKEDKIHVLSLVKDAEIIVGKHSTVLIEAIVTTKSVIIINFASEINFLGIEKIPFISDPNKLKEGFLDILEKQFKIKDDHIRDQLFPIGNESILLMKNEIMRDF